MTPKKPTQLEGLILVSQINIKLETVEQITDSTADSNTRSIGDTGDR
jgi:hypothetical protein